MPLTPWWSGGQKPTRADTAISMMRLGSISKTCPSPISLTIPARCSFPSPAGKIPPLLAIWCERHWEGRISSIYSGTPPWNFPRRTTICGGSSRKTEGPPFCGRRIRSRIFSISARSLAPPAGHCAGAARFLRPVLSVKKSSAPLETKKAY